LRGLQRDGGVMAALDKTFLIKNLNSHYALQWLDRSKTKTDKG
tara:strand:- start:753 stop:881 length:129 start_codon:yes stop_codon:yes gene_type:complete